MAMSFGGGMRGTILMVSLSYSDSSRCAICPWASAMLDLIGLKSTRCVLGLSRYFFIPRMALGSSPSKAWLTVVTISISFEGVAKAWSLSAFLVLATRVAVTLVMKDSMGSTDSLVTPMMYDSQQVLRRFSSSRLLSKCILLMRGRALPISWNTAFEAPSAKSEVSPERMRRRWSLMCEKSSSVSCEPKSTLKRLSCSRSASRFLIRNSWLFSRPLDLAISWLATMHASVQY
mmetsp:Transcript_32638/g.70505  ORF Transcript_32638/g.70505 Transcript_32638/m.70505 type:complete len:232 (-) Transcript_32638:153-848(-)